MTSTPAFPAATILGYPRIGRGRELKRALESFWAGRSSEAELEATAAELRRTNRTRLAGLGLATDTPAIPSDFSFYDQVLDAAVTFGAVPSRFEGLVSDGGTGLGGYSVLARGAGDQLPLEMTKWFDTNYHYLVPEISPSTQFALTGRRVVEEFAEGLADGVLTRPVVVGPVTFLALAKAAEDAPEGFAPLSRLDALLGAYAELLSELAAAGATWVQLDEPALVSDATGTPRAELERAAERAYGFLGAQSVRPAILVTAPFGELSPVGLEVLAASPIEGIALDLVRGQVPAAVPGLENKVLVGGVLNGRNVWREDLGAAADRLAGLSALGASVAAGTSCSLQHVPHDVALEPNLDAGLASWLAFADQKVSALVTLGRGLAEGAEAIADAVAESRAALDARAQAAGVVVGGVRDRVAALTDADARREAYAERAAAQRARLDLPPLPTTTIGSFPQTAEIRKARAANARGELSDADYAEAMRAEIQHVVALQEELGLDVIVHGEPERNDMVQYFAENFDGFAVTENGWVQSYGSRCTRPSLLWGDVSRPA
ncbi:MAG: 5-methyltetrahydropteroyltriglutamate--homocysteine S-methyltransferase, partial [Actinomycetales bacterium]|nr:5-methyltetrahydropteroyltriglutamate--homocysteine S-methyltransferase [Actinomycetales bacterium]